AAAEVEVAERLDAAGHQRLDNRPNERDRGEQCKRVELELGNWGLSLIFLRYSKHRVHAMNLESIVAIDVHTHAWKSALQVDDAPTESQQAMGRYFRYQPQHQTVPEMAQMYRKLKMAFVVFTVDGPLEPRKITNEEVAELANQNSDVAIPFASVNPHRGAEGVAMAKRLILEHKVRGFKFHPSVQ